MNERIMQQTNIKIMEKEQEIFEQLTQIQRVDAPDFLWTRIESKMKNPTDRNLFKRQILVTGFLCLALLALNLTILKKQASTQTTNESANYPFSFDSSNILNYE